MNMNLARSVKTVARFLPFVNSSIEFLYDYQYYLRSLARGSFSQHGEDLFVREYFADRKRPGNYIDVGAGHPFILSNTYILYRSGWRGLILEPIARLIAKHERLRPEDVHLQCAVSDYKGSTLFFEMEPHHLSTCDPKEVDRLLRRRAAVLVKIHRVNVVTLAETCDKYLPSGQLDLLSVDTEGLELQVLQGLDWKAVRPELIICEFSTTTHSSEAVASFLGGKGYRRLRTLGCNSIWGRSPGY